MLTTAAKEIGTVRPVDAARIISIEALPLIGKSPKNGWAIDTGSRDSIHTIIVVHTNLGISGYGSVYTNGDLVKAALKVLEPLFHNENALEPERVSEKLHQHSFWMGRGGTLTHAISGIDIAMWDILGKVVGQPISRLMGGCYRDRVRPYCSLLMQEPAEMFDVVARYREQGFRAFKIAWGPFGRRDNAKLDEAIVRAAREAAGKENALLVDAGGSNAYWPNGLKWAVRTAEMLKDYAVGWFEEPLRPDAIDDYCELRRLSAVPIAGGEVLTRRQAFLPWITRGAFDIAQPDVTKVGGLSEQRRIAWMLDEFGIQYVGHGWNTALGVAADLQLAAALPHVAYVEYIVGSPYVDDILKVPFELDANGYLRIPDGPGLGVDIDPAKLSQYTPSLAGFAESRS